MALHGAEAVAHVQRRVDAGGKLYDLILMDSMMPVMDGATATREIRAMESAYRSSKTGDELRDAGNAQPMIIVGLSAEGGPGYEQESRDAGMDGTLGKPCRPETMRKIETLEKQLVPFLHCRHEALLVLKELSHHK